MVRFEQLGALHWLWVILFLMAVVIIGDFLWRRRVQRFATSNLLGMITAAASGARRWLKAGLVLTALVALVAAMIDPRWGVTYEDVQQRGVDVIIAVDVSRSMLAEDASPNRLDRARQFALDLIEHAGGDRIGLVAFAGTATLRCPLTSDYSAVRLALDELTPLSAARGGSLVGDAIRLSTDAFTDEVTDSKAIIVLSDGEDQGSYPVEAAQRALERGIRVFSVGIGDPGDGARVPVGTDGERVYLTHEGREVWSRMDDASLRELALAGGGAYIPAGRRTVDMGAVYREHITPMTQREFETTVRKVHHAQYQWFAGIALVLLMVDGLVSTRRGGGSAGGSTGGSTGGSGGPIT